MKKKKSKLGKARQFFTRKKLAITFLVMLVAITLYNFRDIIFCSYPPIIMNYRYRYNEMATDDYYEELRSFAYNMFDPISGLNYSQLLTWEYRHLRYWGGQLEVRPELPIEILSTNLLGTFIMKDSSYRIAVYCSKTESYTIYLNEGESTSDVMPLSWKWFGYSLGRCGEFALLYNGLLLATGYESRIVVDCSIKTDNREAGDHVFNEVFVNGTWIHIDPTEGIINSPDMYSNSSKWNKNVNLVYAIQGNNIIDVTETYR